MRNQQQWQELIDQWQNSGLSQTEFCRQNSINRKRFYAWRSRLESNNPSKKSFVQLAVPPSKNSSLQQIEIQLPNKMVFRCSENIEARRLQLILKTIGEL